MAEPFWKIWLSLKAKIHLPYNPALPCHTGPVTQIFTARLCALVPNWEQSECLLISEHVKDYGMYI
jgi:hypothetical protein